MLTDFKYTIKKNKRSKSMRISVRANAEVLVTIPWRMPKYFGERFVQAKKDWILEKIKEQSTNPQKLLSKYSAKDFALQKENARVLVKERLNYFNTFYGFTFNTVSIRNQKSRWGSCSSKKNLNFNYKLVFLPPELADYIVVHELCHLKEMNHGPRFWALVKEQIPDFLERKKKITLY